MIIKFNELTAKAKINCAYQYINIICAYETFEDEAWTIEYIGEDIDEFVKATPNQFYFDNNGDWYDEGRKVK